MLTLIVVLTWLVSLIGMSVMVYRKIPLLREMEAPKGPGAGGLTKIRKRMSEIPFLISGNREILLQKAVSKVRIWALRIESRASGWLENTRKNSQERKRSAHYWEKVRRIAKRRKNREMPT